jgi:TldD protein
VSVMEYDVTDTLEKNIEKSTADVCILRWMRREQLQATVIDGVPGVSSQVILSGMGCRSLVDGSWGLASSTDLHDVEEIISVSERLARYTPGSVNILKIPEYTRRWHPDEGAASLHVMDEFSQIASQETCTIKDLPNIVSCRIGCMMITDWKCIVTSDGVSAQVVEPRVLGNITVIAKSAGTLCQYSEVIGGYGIGSTKGHVAEAAEKAARIALLRLHGTSPPSGRGKVLLKGDVVGLLIHEAVGHAAEADTARKSFLSNKIGMCVAPTSVSVVDDATLKSCFGTVKVDDEGVCGKRTVIIKNGIFCTFLHSRETAYTYGSDPTGNARAWLYSREPSVRMTNTFLAPGDLKVEELVEDIGEGVYLQGAEGGNASLDGTFMIITTLAEKIEKGELTGEFCRGPVIFGDASQILGGLKKIGKEETFVMVPSLCGKSGSAFVGQGGPAVVAELSMGGP